MSIRISLYRAGLRTTWGGIYFRSKKIPIHYGIR